MTECPLSFSTVNLTLPHEDPGEHARLFREWTTAYPSRDPIVRGLVLQAVMALIEIRRLERVRATVRTDKVRTALLRWERHQEDTVERYLQRFNFHAPSALVGLLRSAAGCRWALVFLERLQKLLIDDGTWYGLDKIGAIQIQGFSACISELYYAETAYITWLDCVAAQPNPKQADIDRILDPVNVPKSLLDRDVPLWPRDPGECRARLQAMLDREIPRLRALEATLRIQYEDPSRAEAQTMALADVTQQDMQLVRVQRLHEQSYLQASTALLKFRKPVAAARGRRWNRSTTSRCSPARCSPDRRCAPMPTLANEDRDRGGSLGAPIRPRPTAQAEALYQGRSEPYGDTSETVVPSASRGGRCGRTGCGEWYWRADCPGRHVPGWGDGVGSTHA